MDGAKSTLYLQKPRAQPTQQTISHAQINNYQNAILAQRQIRVSRPSHNSYLRNRAKKSLLFMPCKTNHSQRASLSLLTIYLHNHTNHITSQLITNAKPSNAFYFFLSLSFSFSFLFLSFHTPLCRKPCSAPVVFMLSGWSTWLMNTALLECNSASCSS